MNRSTSQLVASSLLLALAACGGGGSDSSTVSVTPSPTASASLAAGYKQAKWAANVSVTYPSECTMTITSDGQPNHAIDKYDLEPPIGTYTTVVAHASQRGMALVVVPYSVGAGNPPVTFNTCPAKAATTTATTGGGIGLMLSGPALFNATEGQNGKAAALSDNVSYSFTDSTGTARTAKFIDDCNGITSATPEFPSGVYHCVLPEGVTNDQSSLRCYSGAAPLCSVPATPTSVIAALSLRGLQ